MPLPFARRHGVIRPRPVLPIFVAAVVIPLAVAPVTARAEDGPLPAAQEQLLETSDGVRFATWYYPSAAESGPAAVIILIHDVGGSHKTLGDLARSLQRAGYAVVAPDLRGHGSSPLRTAESGATRGDQAESHHLLRKADFEAIAASRGRVRDDPASSDRGEIEAVRAWIKRQSDAGKLDIDRLCVVGSGLGATLAAMWTAADWNWPPTTGGPQGQQVRALVLVSPAMAKRGLSMTGPLASESIRVAVPVLVLAGQGDREASRLFDQFKRFRPKEWFLLRDGQSPETAKDLKAPGDATAFFIQCNTTLSSDKLAADTTINAAEKIRTFLSLALARKRE